MAETTYTDDVGHRNSMEVSDDGILNEARQRWQACDEAENAQRTRIVLAKQFRAGDQWPAAIKIQRSGGQSIQGEPAMPARPCLTIDRLSQPCRQVSNTIKTANFAIDVLPNGFGADTETAEVFKGYLRYVQNRARDDSPVEWAADGSIEGGIGWFRLKTRYCYDDPTEVSKYAPEALYDQELELERITNNLTVYCDPWSLKPTRSDARFMFVTEDLQKDEFKRRWPEAQIVSADDFMTDGDWPAGWVTDDTIRIAEYWRVQMEAIYWLEGREIPKPTNEQAQKWMKERRPFRVFQKPTVECFKITSVQILERWDWLGSKIPLIPILGEELNVDGRPYLRGIIESGMDAQRMNNYMYSAMVETAALAPKAPFVIADDQVAEYKQIWQTANQGWSYLPYKATNNAGTAVPPPQRISSDVPIAGMAQLMAISEEGIKATTGIYDVSLGQQSERAKSGRAIQALQGQSDLGSSNYPDNVRRALIYAGELMVELAPKITRPGQLLHILGQDDEPQQVMIGQPYQEQPNGQLQPLTPQQAQDLERTKQGVAKFYDFTAGRYAVTVSVGKSYTTKREEGAAAIGELIGNMSGTPMAMAMTPPYIRNLSFPGAEGIAEIAEQALPPELRPKSDQEQPDPQQLQAQLMQMQQVLQQLKPLADKNQADLMQAQLKAKADFDGKMLQEQAETQRTQMELQSKERLALVQQMGQLAAVDAKIDAENARTFVEAAEMRISKELDLHMQKLNAVHEAMTQAKEHAHEAGLQAMQQAAQPAQKPAE